jgi:cytochrome c oxidase cbb3-type subunit I/II
LDYTDEDIDYAKADLDKQANEIRNYLVKDKGIKVDANKEIIALIAYLHRLGRDISVNQDLTSN